MTNIFNNNIEPLLNIEKKIDDFVFIISRHVNSKLTNNYWIETYKCIRNIYPDVKIIIIDDDSNYDFVSSNEPMVNIEIIQSEYKKRGELLPYYYFFKNKYAKKAFIIHDSLFIRNKINISNINKVKFIWHHCHNWNNVEYEKNMIEKLNHSDKLLNLYDNQNKWTLCFGVMSIIDYDFLKILQYKYNFFNLLNFVQNRHDRMCLERIFGLLCHSEYPELINEPSIYGIQDSVFDYSFDNYLNDKNNDNLYKPVIKILTGR